MNHNEKEKGGHSPFVWWDILAVLVAVLLCTLIIFGVLPVPHTQGEDKYFLSQEDAQFELWVRKAYDNIGIDHEEEGDKVFVYVNEHWKNGKDEWRYKAIRRLGCAARTEYIGELKPPYTIEILLHIRRRDGSVITETVATGNIDKNSCKLNDFFSIEPSKKETLL